MNTQRLQLVTFLQAKRLKELGYIWHAFAPSYWYDEDGALNAGNQHTLNYYTAPTVALALKWMRDEKNIKNAVYIGKYGWYMQIKNKERAQGFMTYEAAESELLDELLTILEKEK